MVKKSTKSRKQNKVFIDILIAAGVVGFIFALFGVYVYSNLQKIASAPISSETATEDKSDRIIVMYREGTSESRINEIIQSVEGTVISEYDTVGGMSISVPEGTEERAVATLKGYDEVSSANISGTNAAY